MIDFSKIKISEEEDPDIYRHIKIMGGVVVTRTQVLISEATEFQKETARAQVKRELWKTIYGDLAEPVNELKGLVKEYLLEPTEKGYSYHPYFLNSARTKELIDKIDNLLKMPE